MHSSLLPIFGHWTELILFVSLELEQVVMVLPESITMAHSDQSHTLALHVGVEMSFNIDGNCTCAFIQNGVLWLVVNETSHGNSLLLSA